MKLNRQKIFNMLTSRLAMNIYFWALYLLPWVNFKAPPWEYIYQALLCSQLMLLVYFNNLFLVPRLLVKKKYPAYFVSALLAILLVACAYTFTLKLILHYHPGVDLRSFILFVYGSLSTTISFTSVLQEMWSYYINLLNLVFTFTLVWYVRDYYYQRRLTDELKKKQLESELLFLKGQINPHFLFNTLNNLYGLSLEQSKLTSDAILKLSSIMRYFLYDSNSERIAFEKEKEVMLAYIDLELLRLPRKDNFHFSITADAACSIPPLLWLPVLENVFKHGTRFIDNNLMIDFSFSIQNNNLTIYSKNKFRANTHHKVSEGIGINNLRQRLDILYPGKYAMQTSGDNEYFTVKVEIELK